MKPAFWLVALIAGALVWPRVQGNPYAVVALVGLALSIVVAMKRRGKREGWIYLLAGPGGEMGPIKIGRTNDLNRRLREHRTALSGAHYVKTWHVPDARAAERRLHVEFGDLRGDGEWFALSRRELEALKARRRP